MKKTEAEQMPVTDAELDAALAQMAEEVPPMPADFHARWMNAVRAEAGSTASTEEPVRKQPVSIVRWTRILSVAAVFVFLIGGTLLYRNSKKSLTSSVPFAAEERKAAETVVEPAAGAVTEEAEEAEEAKETEETVVEAPLMAEFYAQDAAADGAAGAPAKEETEEKQALKAAGAVQNVFAAAPNAEPAAEEADYAMDAAFEEESAMEEAVYDAAAEAAMPAPTAMLTPEPTAAPTPEQTAVPTVEPEQTGFLPAAGAFFTDMGDFLLAALPYLLVLAVPAVTALVIRRRKNKKER